LLKFARYLNHPHRQRFEGPEALPSIDTLVKWKEAGGEPDDMNILTCKIVYNESDDHVVSKLLLYIQ